MTIVVLKFGSSVLTHDDAFHTLVHDVYREVRDGHRVVAVVSAVGRTTDQLITQAASLSHDPDRLAYASLLATGEATSAAKAAIALDAAGIPTSILDPLSIGLRTSGDRLNAEPISLNAASIRRTLERTPVVVIPGFIGCDESNQPTLLGRGGSDLTAVFIAHQLGARCRLVKDVDGWFVADPARGPHVHRYERLSWGDAIESEAPIVQHRAVEYAGRHQVGITIAAPGSGAGTYLGHGPTRHAPVHSTPPLRVVLLGLGVVGQGVYRHLADDPARFSVRKVLVKHPDRPRDVPVPRHLLTTDPNVALNTDCDVVVELIPGADPASAFIAESLRRGRCVVSANKAAIARDRNTLMPLARSQGALLLHSAAVGGSVPMLPTVERIAHTTGVRRIRGVLNGTTNFILNRLADGLTYADALADAQRLGFAELDPSADVTGLDAARKIIILANAAFNANLTIKNVPTDGLAHLADSPAICPSGHRLRLVASCESHDGTVRASVRLLPMPLSDPLASLQAERVGITITPVTGSDVFLSGRGAGRWPTAAAVLADIRDVATHLAATSSFQEAAR